MKKICLFVQSKIFVAGSKSACSVFLMRYNAETLIFFGRVPLRVTRLSRVPLSLQPPHYAFGFVAWAACGALPILRAIYQIIIFRLQQLMHRHQNLYRKRFLKLLHSPRGKSFPCQVQQFRC